MHTDAAYHAEPESAFILVCERPANDGGDSLILTVSDLMTELEEALLADDAPQFAQQLLRTSIWSLVCPQGFPEWANS